MSISELIEQIAAVEMPNVFNPWRQNDPLDSPVYGVSARRFRLHRHFDCSPRFLLIGEAPGYQGCHFSGIPFTNERLLIKGLIPRISPPVRITTREKPWSEPSATVVWGSLRDLGIANETVLWNAFAWHPHKPNQPYTNRTPTLAELFKGQEILRLVVRRFAAAQVVAIGNKSRDLLAHLGFTHVKHVRHPSMGGATEFRKGLSRIVAARNGTAQPN